MVTIRSTGARHVVGLAHQLLAAILLQSFPLCYATEPPLLEAAAVMDALLKAVMAAAMKLAALCCKDGQPML